MVTSRFRRPTKLCCTTYTEVSAHMKNTTAKRRDLAKQMLGQLRKVAEENYAYIVVGDLNTSANRECGKANMSSIEEAWE